MSARAAARVSPFLLWLSGCAAEAPGPDPSEPQPQENVLVVLLDDVPADRVSTYGLRADAAPTPTLDALAAEGMTFRNAWAMPVCSAARASLLTGRYPSRHGVGHIMEDYSTPTLAPTEVTLPEMLPDAWDTSQVGKWHVASYDGHEDNPGLQGFRWFAGTKGNIHISGLGADYWSWEKNDNGSLSTVTRYATEDATDDAIGRIEAMTEPWLLYMGAYAAHSPYHAPPPELVPGEFPTVESQYLALIRAVDAELGRLLDGMDPEVRARTTIVVMGDNGEPWDLDDAALDTNGRVKGSVFQSGVHVPLVVAGPRVGAPGTVTDALVSIVDLFPTLAEIGGGSVGTLEHPIDGVSLLPVLADPDATVRDTVFTEAFYTDRDSVYGAATFSHTYALRDERFKLVVRDHWTFVSTLPAVAVELYDLEQDPAELDDLADDPAYSAELERLRGEADALFAEMASG